MTEAATLGDGGLPLSSEDEGGARRCPADAATVGGGWPTWLGLG